MVATPRKEAREEARVRGRTQDALQIEKPKEARKAEEKEIQPRRKTAEVDAGK
jgi:hypothetical protein